MRFQREAKTLASLNHPNIGGILGLEESRDVTALVLELVEGPTLADRLARGPVPVDDALSIARQIADALQATRSRGKSDSSTASSIGAGGMSACGHGSDARQPRVGPGHAEAGAEASSSETRRGWRGPQRGSRVGVPWGPGASVEMLAPSPCR